MIRGNVNRGAKISKELEEFTRVRVLLDGRVQGVGFRYWTQKTALKQGVAGWVRNLEDGRVETVLEGTSVAVEQMLSLLKRGPIAARVDSCAVEVAEYTGEFSDFELRRS